MSAEAELQAAREARIAGTMTQGDYLEVVERLAPKIEAAGAAPEPDRATAARMLDELRQRRIDGKVNASDYFREMDRLGAIAAGEEPGSVPADPFDRQIAEIMRPAAPGEYAFTYRNGPPANDSEAAADAALRVAFSDIGIPRHLGGPIHDAIAEGAARLASANEADRALHVERFQSFLRQQWGSDYDARQQAVSAFVVEAAERHPVIAKIVDDSPWLLADARVANYLWTIAEYQERMGKR